MYCKKCLYPQTKQDLWFNEDGICSACLAFDARSDVPWEERKSELNKIVANYKKDSGYDCIVPVSGGKDSTYQLLQVLNLGLKPLAVISETCDLGNLGQRNINNIKKIGVDVIQYSTSKSVRAKLNRAGLELVGDISWPEHVSIFTTPIQVAVNFNIPLVIWGENPQFEYGQPTDISKEILLDKEWNEKNGGYFLDKIKPKDMTKYGFELKDLKPYIYPSDEEIKKVGVNAVFLGSYIKWDIFKQLELVKKLGFKEDNEIREGTYDSWENIDVKFTSFHDYFKFLKFGFGRATDHASIEIRLGRMTREKGLELVKKHEGRIPVKYLDEFLKEAEISYDEFIIICEKYTNKKLFKKDKNGKLLRNQEGNIENNSYDN